MGTLVLMSEVSTQIDPMAVQRARAARLRDLFEPWSYRRLATRTGLSKAVVASRLSGETPLSMPEFEVLAPVVRMTPEELFSELLTVDPTAKLPGHDSNVQPIGSESAPENVLPFHPRTTESPRAHHPSAGTVTPIRQAQGE